MILQKVKCVEGTEYSVKIWDGENLGKEVCIDFESTVAPFYTRNHEPVVLQAFGGTKDIYLVRLQDAKAFLNCHYLSSLIGQNIPFDMGVLSKLVPWKFIFEYYDANRVFDTRTMWNLYNLAAIGDTANQDELSLKAIYRRLFGHEIDKNQDIRTTFGDYLGMQYEDMPKDHLAYAALDVVYTYNVYCKLRSLIKEHDKYGSMLSMHIRVRGELAIDQMYKNGIGIDLSKKDVVKAEYEVEVAKYARKMAMWGIVEGRVGVNDMKQKALDILGIANKLPKTKSGISTAKDDLKDFSHIPFISDYLNWQANKSMLKYLVDLEDPVIYPSYNSLLVTGRISASKGHNGIPVQQLPRDGGIRDLFIARSPDKALVDVDYDGIELSALGHIQQMLYGSSRMADILNTGRDLHTATAAAMFKVDAGPCTKKDMGQVTKEMRQKAKMCYSSDTELLTKKGWIKISDIYNTDTEIAQVNPHNANISFVSPLSWYKGTTDKMYNFISSQEDTLVSEDHRMLLLSNSNNYVVEATVDEYSNVSKSYSSMHGGFYNFENTISDIDTRIAVMIQADGSYKGRPGYVRLGFSKTRKIKRCRELLTKANIPFSEKVYRNGKYGCTTNFLFKLADYTPHLTQNKEFISYQHYNNKAFINELPLWDGSNAKGNTKFYYNNCKRSVNIAQTIIALSGLKTNIKSKGCSGYSLTWYTGHGKTRPYTLKLSYVNSNIKLGNFDIYCPSVPTSWVLTRRNGKIVVHGNCNFGFGANMAPDVFVRNAKKQETIFSLQEATNIKESWVSAYPEMDQWFREPFNHVDGEEWDERKGRMKNTYAHYTLTGRKKAFCSYTEFLNCHFQGISADGMLEAMYDLFKAGHKLCLSVHDNLVVEANKGDTQALRDVCTIMVKSMRKVITSTKVGVEGRLTPHLGKKADGAIELALSSDDLK